MAEGYGPIANQRTKGHARIKLPTGDIKSLPPGSYIKCIRREYLPKYHPFGEYNEDLYIAAYTQFGMALLEKCDIEWNVY